MRIRSVGWLVFLIVAALIAPDQAHAMDKYYDGYLSFEQHSNYGRGKSDSREGGTLGWGEYGSLQNYIAQYDATSSTLWLDKIVAHADRMLDNTRDDDGDGYLGWLDLRYSHNQLKNAAFALQGATTGAPDLLVNGGFESEGALPDGWQILGAATGVYRSTAPADVFNGNAAIVISSDAGPSRLVQRLTVTPGVSYLIDYYATTNEGQTQARLEVADGATGTKIGGGTRAHVAGYERYVKVFTAPPSGIVDVRLGLQHYTNPGWSVRFDGISLRELGAAQPCSTIARTEMAAWSPNTDSGSAFRTNDPAAGGTAAVSGCTWVARLVNSGATAPQISQVIENYEPDRPYGLSAKFRGSRAGLRVVDETTNTVLVDEQFPGDGFLERYVYFRTPPAGHRLRADIYLADSTPGAAVSVKDAFAGELFEQMVHEANVMIPVLQFVNAVYDDPALARYRGTADRYTAFIAENLTHKWDSEWRQVTGVDGADNGQGVYAFPPGLSTEWFPSRSLPYNQFLVYANMLYWLADAADHHPVFRSERPYYLSRANDMNRLFKSAVYSHPKNAQLQTDAYMWRYWDRIGPWDDGHYAINDPDGTYFLSEDHGHASLTLTGPVTAYLHGQVWTADDMRRFSNTFIDVMWNKSTTDPKITPTNFGGTATTINIGPFQTLTRVDADAYTVAVVFDQAGKLADSGYANYSRSYRNKIINTQFEWDDIDNIDMPQAWERASMSGSITRTEATARLGRWAMSIQQSAIQQRIPSYEPNTPYTVWLRGSVNSGDLTAELYDYTTNRSLGKATLTDKQWGQAITTTVATPNQPGHDVRVIVTATGSATVDQIRAVPTPVESEVPNGGFEILNRTGDQTVPKHWQRGPETSANLVTLDSTQPLTGRNSIRLTTAPDAAVQALTYDWQGYFPSQRYSLKWTGKSTGPGAILTVTDAATGQLLARSVITSAQWTTRTVNFTAPATYDRTLRVTLTHQDPSAPNATIFVDNLTVDRPR